MLFSADGTRLLAYPEGRADAQYTVPDGVTEIGAEAFSMCKALADITLPIGLISIGDYAFAQCTGLTEMHLPAGLLTIGNDAFCDCANLTAIVLPDSVTAIGEEAFCDCLSLLHITLPAKLSEIGTYAFSGCESLTAITLPKALKTVGDGAFLGCSALSAFAVEPGNAAYQVIDGVLLSADGTTLCAYPGGKAGSLYTIPSSITTISPYAMAGVAALEDINLLDGLTEIGERAFGYDSNVKAITLPASLSTIGAGAFAFCDSLTAIEVENGNEHFASDDGVLFSADKTTLYAYPAGKPDTAYTVASTVDAIESAAFAGATRLQSVTLENATSNIGADAFDGCSDDLVLYGAAGSTAAMYALRYDLAFAQIGTTPTSTAPSEPTAVPTTAPPTEAAPARTFPWLWIGVGAALLLLVAVGLLLRKRRRS